MTLIDIAACVLGLVGIAFGARCYVELHRWARQCQHARVAVAYKRKVQLQGSLVEWLLWANQLDTEAATRGRVVYRNRDVSVAILRDRQSRSRVHSVIARVRNARRPRKAPTPQG